MNKNQYWLGKKRSPRSEIWRKKISKNSKKQLLNKPINFWLNKKRPDMVGNKFQKLGKANWKGGITPLMELIRHSYKNRQWISDVFTRDNYTCQNCGKYGGNINADHFPKMFKEIFYENKIVSLEQALNCEEFCNINNGRTLCEKCHKLIGRKK